MQLKKLIFTSILSCLSLASADHSEYLDFYNANPSIGSLGDHKKGEIEVVLDKEEMTKIEKATGRQCGIISQDKYWIWLNDAVIFPNGHRGVYGRILWRNSLYGTCGVAVLPVLKNQKIALNLNYRHATRSWELELPRGGKNPEETPEDAAIRELCEETGMTVKELISLGNVTPDSGLTNTVAKLYLAKVDKIGSSNPEDSEAIDSIVHVDLETLKTWIMNGSLKTVIKGEEKTVFVRDPFLNSALLITKMKNLL